jgi:sulfate/thiosulfate-binding protein
MKSLPKVAFLLSLFVAIGLLTSCKKSNAESNVTLLNVSYDPTRELYADYNELFAKHYKAQSGKSVSVKQSHGGSGKQARAVLDGLDADVVTLALAYDVDVLSDKGQLVPKDWQARLPEHSAPYTSTIVMVVRSGNPKGIKDFGDLAKDGVGVITPNPKTSGGARWNYLALWGYALRQPGGTPETAREFVKKVFANVPVLDSGARGSTTTFVERQMGDVLLSWENEAILAVKDLGKGKLEIIVPKQSILAEPPVSVVDKNVDKKGTRAAAEEYLKFLYSPEAQEIVAKHHFRPRDAAVAKKHEADFQKLELFTVDEVFGGWRKAQGEHFDDGKIFDQISIKK